MSRVSRGDRGTAVLEFVVLALLLAVPIAQALTAVLSVHRTRTPAQTAAAAAALAVARQGPAVAEEVVRRHLPAEQRPRVRVQCRPGCAVPGGVVTVRVAARTPLPIGQVTVVEDHSQVVDLYATR